METPRRRLRNPQIPPPGFAASTVGDRLGTNHASSIPCPSKTQFWLLLVAGPYLSVRCRPRDSLRGEEVLVLNPKAD